MGRIYQTLANGRQGTAAASSAPAVEVVAPTIMKEEEIPFIEVGAPEPRPRVLPFTRPVAPPVVPPPKVDMESEVGSDTEEEAESPAESEMPVESRNVLPLIARQPDSIAPLRIRFRAMPSPVRGLALPHERFASALIAYHDPEHMASEEYRGLATEIAAQLASCESRMIGILNAIPQSGATTVILNLAVSLALEGERVLLLDAHPSRPMLARSLGLVTEPGYHDVRAGLVPLQWALYPSGQENLTLLPYGRRHPSIIDPASLCTQLRRRYDWILIDTPQDEAIYCDGLYLTVRQQDLADPDVAEFHDDLIDEGGVLRGYILTGE